MIKFGVLVFLVLVSASEAVNWKLTKEIETFLGTLEPYTLTPNEVIFLLDESGSIGADNYEHVKKFTELVVRHLSVSSDHSRVAIVSFSSGTRIHINYIANSKGHNMCTLISKIMGLDYAEGGTHTSEAMLKAKELFVQSRQNSNRLVILITDGESNFGYSPIKVATSLKNDGVIIFAVGVAEINKEEVEGVATSLNHTYILNKFEYIRNLTDQIVNDTKEVSWETAYDISFCNSFCDGAYCCDDNADCYCGTRGGNYECNCNAGYSGTGHRGDCHKCPKGTYKNKIGNDICKSCDSHATTISEGSTSSDQCVCENGYQAIGNKCKAISCPRINVPDGGVLIPSDCDNTYGSKCSVKCKEGYCPHSCNFLHQNQNYLISEHVSLQSRSCLSDGNWSGQEFHCEKIRCPTLDHPDNGKHNCSGSDFTFGTVCEISCGHGFEISGSYSRTCRLDGKWTGENTKCSEIFCPPLKINDQLTVKPKSCSSEEKSVGTRCQYHCLKGYGLYGEQGKSDGINECLINKTWSGERSISCKDEMPPMITCPKSIQVSTDPMKRTAAVKWSDPIATDNIFVGSVRIKHPPNLGKLPYAFPIGTTKVTYEAVDGSNNSNICSFSVTVIDNEKPVVAYCPSDFEVYHHNKSLIPITWEEPIFVDNSNETKHIMNPRKSGDEFGWGTHDISYTMSDYADNLAYCNFTIIVKPYPCPPFEPPANGIATCDNWMDSTVCSAFCKEGYEFATENVPDAFLCHQQNGKKPKWVPLLSKSSIKLPLPDCSMKQKRSATSVHLTLNYIVNDPCNKETMFKMKKIFINTLEKKQKMMNGICIREKGCSAENVTVTCESPKLKYKRSTQRLEKIKSILIVSFNVNMQSVSSNEEFTKHNFENDTALSDHPILKGLTQEVSEDIRTFYDISEMLEPFVQYKVDSICTSGQLRKGNSCVSCPPGTFKHELLETCLDCPYASYQPSENSLTCLPCPKGYMTYNNRSKSVEDCKGPCKRGSFSRSTFEPCRLCPLNTYQSNNGNKDCKRCPGELQTATIGSTSIDDCVLPCPPGSFSATGLEPCQQCEAGYYQDQYEQTECVACPQDKTTKTEGSTRERDCTVINKCDELKPCPEGSTCIVDGNGYLCKCPYGLYGKHCEKSMDVCEGKPCQNNGSCSNDYGRFWCSCVDGFTGLRCETNIDDCTPDSCIRGKCIDLTNSYKCECDSGFTGNNCEINLNDCPADVCMNSGTCVDGVNNYRCCCTEGYTGDHCEIRIDSCEGIICQHGGNCAANGDSFTCNCMPGYEGELCEININDCVNIDCLGRGECIDGVQNASCKCDILYAGDRCQQELNPDYMMSFQDHSTANYAKLENNQKLEAFTVSFFMRSNFKADQSHPTPVSYSFYDEEKKQLVDNGITLFNLNNLILYLHGEAIHTSFEANRDFQWHHYAVTWERSEGKFSFIVDGQIELQGDKIGKDKYIWPGIFVLGQEQDGLGSIFSTTEAFVGDIQEFNVWDYVLSDDQIISLSSSCGKIGNIIPWLTVREYIHGQIYISENTDLCNGKVCKEGDCHCIHSKFENSNVCRNTVNNCNPNPCQNDQLCLSDGRHTFCDCSSGLSGRFCEYDKNECFNNNGGCSHICNNIHGSYECRCPSNMVLKSDKHTCKDDSFCDGNGEIHLNGERWTVNCDEECFCDGGIEKCVKINCETTTCAQNETLMSMPGECCPACTLYSTCVISNKTLKTFNQKTIYLKNQSSYDVIEDCSKETFEVQYQLDTNIAHKKLAVYHNCLSIEILDEILNANEDIDSEAFEKEVLHLTISNGMIKILFRSGLYIRWQNKDLLVKAPKTILKNICGLCSV